MTLKMRAHGDNVLAGIWRSKPILGRFSRNMLRNIICLRCIVSGRQQLENLVNHYSSDK